MSRAGEELLAAQTERSVGTCFSLRRYFAKRSEKMDEQKINRINELYRKSKAEGLTEEEKLEQKILRRQYVDAFKQNLRSQLNQIDIKEKDGSIVNLGQKYGNKKGN